MLSDLSSVAMLSEGGSRCPSALSVLKIRALTSKYSLAVGTTLLRVDRRVPGGMRQKFSWGTSIPNASPVVSSTYVFFIKRKAEGTFRAETDREPSNFSNFWQRFTRPQPLGMTGYVSPVKAELEWWLATQTFCLAIGKSKQFTQDEQTFDAPEFPEDTGCKQRSDPPQFFPERISLTIAEGPTFRYRCYEGGDHQLKSGYNR